ncbi:hypothetical protein RYX36_008319 [Vicia faba]
MAVVVRCSCFLSCLSLKLDKVVPLLKDTLNGSSKISTVLHCLNCKEDMPQRFPLPLFLASNILMFLMPCKALAETCETDNSLFNFSSQFPQFKTHAFLSIP